MVGKITIPHCFNDYLSDLVISREKEIEATEASFLISAVSKPNHRVRSGLLGEATNE